MIDVLVVDDSSTIRKMLSSLFMDLKLNVVAVAASGEEGFHLYEQHKPNLVTMDVNMPGISGIDTLKKIRHIDNNANILMLTSRGDEGVVAQSIKYGAKGYILKPLNRDKIKEAITNLFPNEFKKKEERKEEDKVIQNYDSSIKDPLTDLYSVQYMHYTIEHLIQMHDRNDAFSIGLLIININNLDEILNTYGALQKDVILTQAAEEILSIIRTTDFAIRLTDNEFGVFILGSAIKDMIILANRLKYGIEAIENKVAIENTSLVISIGMAIHTKEEKLIDFISRTDDAVKEATKINESRIHMSE